VIDYLWGSATEQAIPALSEVEEAWNAPTAPGQRIVFIP
jgi:hypothetical protein